MASLPPAGGNGGKGGPITAGLVSLVVAVIISVLQIFVFTQKQIRDELAAVSVPVRARLDNLEEFRDTLTKQAAEIRDREMKPLLAQVQEISNHIDAIRSELAWIRENYVREVNRRDMVEEINRRLDSLDTQVAALRALVAELLDELGEMRARQSSRNGTVTR